MSNHACQGAQLSLLEQSTAWQSQYTLNLLMSTRIKVLNACVHVRCDTQPLLLCSLTLLSLLAISDAS